VALGAEESVAWEYVADAVELVRRLKRDGVQIVVLESTKTSQPFDEVEYDFPLCLVVGHEFDGVSQEMLEQADQVVSIPMLGAKISLNVSVAFGVAVYEILKAKKRTVLQS
jgi:tRNA G18 (ribose-2'-O)-methylase SpoU